MAPAAHSTGPTRADSFFQVNTSSPLFPQHTQLLSPTQPVENYKQFLRLNTGNKGPILLDHPRRKRQVGDIIVTRWYNYQHDIQYDEARRKQRSVNIQGLPEAVLLPLCLEQRSPLLVLPFVPVATRKKRSFSSATDLARP